MTSANMAPLLSVRDLRTAYRLQGAPRRTLEAVRGVSFDIPEGGIVGLVGESGSGKTSLAHALLGLQRQCSGQVLLDGKDLLRMKASGLRAARRDIQAIFQDPLASLSPRRNILQSLLEPLDHFGIGPRKQRPDLARKALEAVELDPDLASRYPHEISGGQRQRAALARAVVTKPRLIIADEPVSSLDIPMQARMIGLFSRLREQTGIAFLFISHDLSVVRKLADSVVVMYLGRILESGPARQVLGRPAHPYTRSLLNAIPSVDPEHAAPQILAGEAPSPLTPPPGCVFHTRCEEALSDCRLEEPGARSAGASEHCVKCHLWNP